MTTPEADETAPPEAPPASGATATDEAGPASAPPKGEADAAVDGDAAAEAEAETAEGEPEATEPPPPPPADPRDDRIKTLIRALEASETQLREYIKAHKKAKAEWEAYRLRLQRDQEAQVEAARGKVVERFLDVSDNLERSLEAAGADTANLDTLRDGMGLIHRQFNQALEGLGLRRYDPTGEEFDPNSMEALGLIPVTDPAQDHRVVYCIKPGFRFGDRELRPALVQVGRFAG